MASLYDKKGREIIRGDVLKMYHFTGARRKKHYLYKQVLGPAEVGDFLKVGHLDFSDDFFLLRADGSVRDDCEIVASLKCDHDDRVQMSCN